MTIKSQLGKLTFRRSLLDIVAEHRGNGLTIMEATFEHAQAFHELPPLHKDPFDRLLIAQTQAEGARLVSADRAFGPYGIPVLW